ncbi:MAG: hypothetical protein ACJAWV_000284 [Flammeovirgaceae bacterium]|jgi:hypothetical protein
MGVRLNAVFKKIIKLNIAQVSTCALYPKASIIRKDSFLHLDVHPNELAWSVIQEFGHVVNYLSLDERLPTIFYPASPPPYLNGGPNNFLSWVIETKDKEFKPETLMEWLEGRLPRLVNDLEQWNVE